MNKHNKIKSKKETKLNIRNMNEQHKNINNNNIMYLSLYGIFNARYRPIDGYNCCFLSKTTKVEGTAVQLIL